MKIRHPHKQNGAFLVISAVVFIVLLGFAALALDLGRVFVQQSEMQNAADAAARSGAWELDGEPDARKRAVIAAKDTLSHRGRFSRNPELLDQLVYKPGDPDTSPIVFYSWIGSAEDLEVDEPNEHCEQKLNGEWLPERARCLSTDDRWARYMEIWLDPARAGNADAYTVDLLFLPALEVLGDEVARFATVSARAVAGRHFFACDYPPMMLCNPLEGIGKNFSHAVAEGYIQVGDSVVLRQENVGGSHIWAPGNFGLLQIPNGKKGEVNKGSGGGGGNSNGGLRAVGEYIADPKEKRDDCTTGWVGTRPGNPQSHPVWGWNTRFDYYKSFNAKDFSPAPNVIEYPQDIGSRYGNELFGNGDWDREGYWDTFHGYHEALQPLGWDSWTRYEVYQWELNSGLMPCDPNGPDGIRGTSDDIACPPGPISHYDLMSGRYSDPWSTPEPDRRALYTDPADRSSGANPIVEGLPNQENISETRSMADRRVIFVAIVDCTAQNLRGQRRVFADTFAKFFVLQAATQRGSTADYVVEFMGLANEDDDEYFVEVQLYE
ncbi:pilus assembly protein TadG-related protein [Halorhodospira sp. 9622]|uniref:pilus assembly protein TadG-related protein n=1 Tax=Halorhodospira sp. 9622 TaxID=2899136 RepID=UPI001EE8FFF5|nr:Tad domain-containing protein [Halorhodospira sp. 9622]MCG5538634.1 Tad domain-containing protein [Halorhodospira sp. 9622]